MAELRPTYKQEIAIVLWAQGFNARAIGQILGVSNKAIYRRLERIKKNFPEAHARAKSMRRCNLNTKANIKHARRYPEFKGDRLGWYDTESGMTEHLKILRKF